MWRALKYLLIVGVIGAIAVWFADRPGSVSLQWQGYQIDTSAAILFAGISALVVIAALLYRAWGAVRRSPKAIRRAMAESRRKKGYKALTQGMVAVAAGDPGEAQKHRRKAEQLLDEPPLTMLLSAQAAQLAGDEKAAERFFTAMLDNAETKFLGYRGLLMQATKNGDRAKALSIAEKARKIKPNSLWLKEHLFDLQTREGQWADALHTLSDAGRKRDRITDDPDGHMVALDVKASEDAEKAGDSTTAMKLAKNAVKISPSSTPAVLRLVELHNRSGHGSRAAKVLEDAWMRKPHPSYVAPYLAIKKPESDLSAVKVIQRLVRNNAKHMESQLAIAEVSLKAKLWGEARAALEQVLAMDHGKTQRVCKLMADLETQENQDFAKARQWLIDAGAAELDSVWVCSYCGNATETWSALCGNCGSFDTFKWERPRHVASLTEAGGSETRPENDAAQAGENLPAPVAVEGEPLPPLKP